MPGGLHPPLSVMESWPARNTINPETHGAASIVLPVIFGSIAVTAVILRLWARCVIQRQGKLDDIFIALALVRQLLRITIKYLLTTPRSQP